MAFAKEMIEAVNLLKEFSIDSYISPDTYDCLNNPDSKLNEDLDHCEKMDIMKTCMDIQKDCDAILVLNYQKNNTDGYIGSHSLIEMGLAYYLNQKIFLLNTPPSLEKARYFIEVMHMKPIILDGDIKKIKDYLE